MQTPSGHCRCKKTQTPSRHEPKTAQTASQKTVSRYLWNPHKTIFGATEHMSSLCKHHLDTADAERPKHRLDTSRKPPKPQAKKLFHVTFGIHIKQSLEPQSRRKLNINDRRRLMPKSCEIKKKFGLKTPRRAPPLGGVGGLYLLYNYLLIASFNKLDRFSHTTPTVQA